VSQPEAEMFYAGVYGPGRGDSRDSCIQRTLRMFGLLKDVDPTFAQWFERGWTRKEALRHRLDQDAGKLAKALKKVTAGDEYWYFASIWTGLSDWEASSMSLSCGHNDSRGVDTIILTPHETDATGQRLMQAPVMTALLRALAIAWEPQMGIVMSHRHREAAFKDAEFEHRIGWVNYFARSLGPLPPLPDPVRVEPVDDIGSLVILTPERFATSNPAHVALSLQVSATLKDAGVLKPLLAPPPPSGATP